MFVVETRLGQSLQQAGFEGVLVNNEPVGIFHNSNRPSLQLLAGADFGNGSAAVCDGSPVIPPGGVPGFDPPWIDCSPALLTPAELALCNSRQAAVGNALTDVACRFNYVQVPNSACTRNQFGDFSFLNSSSTRQYCFQIPVDAELDPGDRVVAVQVRDVGGNLGPVREIVVRVVP